MNTEFGNRRFAINLAFHDDLNCCLQTSERNSCLFSSFYRFAFRFKFEVRRERDFLWKNFARWQNLSLEVVSALAFCSR